jgi:hypothetical protein
MVESVPVPVGAQPLEADTAPPVLRHTAQPNITVGDTLVIQAVVEDDSELSRVDVWYRPAGAGDFERAEASKLIEDERLYEARIVVTGAFSEGLEYYLDATDQFENRGVDGSDTVPYFVAVSALPALSGLSTGSEEGSSKRAWWKRPWVWVTVIAVVAGGAAIAARNDQETGTVVVE